MSRFGLDELKATVPALSVLKSSQLRGDALLACMRKHATHPAFKGSRVIRPTHLKADHATVHRGGTEVNPTVTIHCETELFRHLCGGGFGMSRRSKHRPSHGAQPKQGGFINGTFKLLIVDG